MKPSIFTIHSVNKQDKTMLIELNDRAIDDILESIDEKLLKIEKYPIHSDQGERLRKYRDIFHLNLPKFK